jgi:UDP-3-O-[3-hydroxymyristoyl] glucosamine N-acyltransferase LpxD
LSFITEHNEKYKDFNPISDTIPFKEDYYHARTNVRIGKGTILYPNVIIYDNVTIGNNCVIDSGAVIGAEGFSIHWEDDKWVQMRNVGGVLIGDRVKIGANTCIDRASLEGRNTVIWDDAKIDNLVHIAHNVEVGFRSIILPQVCIGGSTDIGNDVWIGMGALLREHISVGSGSYITMGSVVIANVDPSSRVGGYYATDHHKWKYFSRLVRNGAL